MKQSENPVVINPVETNGLSAGLAGVKRLKRGRPKLVVNCDSCKQDIGPLDKALSQRKLEKGFFEVGLTCPHCGLWVHSYYTNDELEQTRKTLQRFANNAYKSLHHTNNYLKQKAKFQREHNRVQEMVKELIEST